jgi:hypothetical protein
MDASRPTTALTASYSEAWLTERRKRPLGRFGRRLLPEIELYLEFFAIARAQEHADDGAPAWQPAWAEL